MPNSLWRYTCDYPVIGIRDISDLDDKSFVRQRKKKKQNSYNYVFCCNASFIFAINFITNILKIILA